ncbi:flagellar basal body rod protein [Paenibacillus agilis]|uniref:Flagellar basal body rod protein n=1 Tax=Paenibacillus agilis TaxID=3020863 RepID=A0A559J3M1_9BACL|nr:flagellar basal body rod protein [Paenibacillus agilis]TVX94477.1 flagellar basal body rod protein [Paenibacillus agilis]
MKHIQAYTRTENEAESLRIPLISLGIQQQHIEIGRLEEPFGQGQLLLAPISSNPGGVNYAGGNAMHPAGSGVGVVINKDDGAEQAEQSDGQVPGIVEDERFSEEREQAPNDLSYVISIKLDSNHYIEALKLLRRQGAYVE